MNTPRQPEDPPPEGASPDANPGGNTPRGVPKGAEHEEAKGGPAGDDRHATETAVQRIEGT